MTGQTPRELAERFRAVLDEEIADPAERAQAAARLDAALAAATASRSASAGRAWLAREAPVDKERDRGLVPLPGTGVSLAVYYVCPNGDYDLVLEAPPAVPPRCPNDGQEMITEG